MPREAYHPYVVNQNEYSPTGFVFRFSDDFLQLYTASLRTFFLEDPLTEDYRWSPDPKESKISILEEFADEEKAFPQIVVGSVIQNLQEISLGRHQDHGSGPTPGVPDLEDGFIRKGGEVRATISFGIYSTAVQDRNKIADILMLGLAYPITIMASRLGVDPVSPTMARVISVGQQPLTSGKNAHTAELQIPVRSTWYQDFKEEVAEINAITITPDKTETDLPFPTSESLVIDDFNRVDNVDLTRTWLQREAKTTDPTGPEVGAMSVSSNRLKIVSADVGEVFRSVASWNEGAIGDQFSSLVFVSGSNGISGPAIRMSLAGSWTDVNMYHALYDERTKVISLYRTDGQGSIPLGAGSGLDFLLGSVSRTLVSGEILTLEGRSSNLQVRVDGIKILEVEDATFANGEAGLGGRGLSSPAATEEEFMLWDNWNGGALT